jgi:hypothetical protein
MRIPEIRDRLRELAGELSCPELDLLASELSRRPVRRRAAPSSAPMTAEMRDAIRAFHIAHPDRPQVEVARVFNVNPGRVSEALNGFRS